MDIFKAFFFDRLPLQFELEIAEGEEFEEELEDVLPEGQCRLRPHCDVRANHA